jgi:hypothetical protein
MNFAPLITHRENIGVADAVEKDCDVHVALGWFASRDLGGRQR